MRKWMMAAMILALSLFLAIPAFAEGTPNGAANNMMNTANNGNNNNTTQAYAAGDNDWDWGWLGLVGLLGLAGLRNRTRDPEK